MHSPQNHHVEGVVGDAGDEGREGDEEDGREQEVGTGDGARSCLCRSRSPSHTAAVQIDLEKEKEEKGGRQLLLLKSAHTLNQPFGLTVPPVSSPLPSGSPGELGEAEFGGQVRVSRCPMNLASDQYLGDRNYIHQDHSSNVGWAPVAVTPTSGYVGFHCQARPTQLGTKGWKSCPLGQTTQQQWFCGLLILLFVCILQRE